MNVAVFSTKRWVKDGFEPLKDEFNYNVTYFEAKLNKHTAKLSTGFDAICAFVNDDLSDDVLSILSKNGIKLVALRCAGFNNVNLKKAEEYNITIVRVPAYSPYSVAEHALGLVLTLNRKYHRAYTRVRDGNFSLDGLMGFDIHGKTIGIIGTGKIGQIFAGLLSGFGCKIIAYDKYPNENLKKDGVEYVSLQELYERSDIISLHCPLTHETYHTINEYAIKSMKDGVMIINTSRGPLIDTHAVISGLKSGRVGYLGLDVYEEEEALFFEDLSEEVIQDDMFVRLQTFPNVLITSHQAFFTKEATTMICKTTFENIREFEETGTCVNIVRSETR